MEVLDFQGDGLNGASEKKAHDMKGARLSKWEGESALDGWEHKGSIRLGRGETSKVAS